MTDDTIIIDTAEGIRFARLAALKAGLKIEMKTGMRVSRGRTAYSLLRRMGYRGNRQRVLDAVEADIKAILTAKEGN